MGNQAMGSDPTVLEELRLNQIEVMLPLPIFFFLYIQKTITVWV